MRFNYTKTVLIITGCGAGALFVAGWIWSLIAGTPMPSGAPLIAQIIIVVPIMLIADLVSWVRWKRALRRGASAAPTDSPLPSRRGR